LENIFFSIFLFKKQTEVWSIDITDEKVVFRKAKTNRCKIIYFEDFTQEEAAYLKENPHVFIKALNSF